MNNNQGHFIDNTAQPDYNWSQEAQRENNRTQQYPTQTLQQLLKKAKVGTAATTTRRITPTATETNGGMKTFGTNGSPNTNTTESPVQFALPANLALPARPATATPTAANTTEAPTTMEATAATVSPPTAPQSPQSARLSSVAVKASPSQPRNVPTTAPFLTSPFNTSRYMATTASPTQSPVSNAATVVNSSATSAAAFAAVVASQGNTTPGAVVVPSAATSPVTPTAQNPTLAQDVIQKQQRELLRMLNKYRTQQQTQLSQQRFIQHQRQLQQQQLQQQLQQQRNTHSFSTSPQHKNQQYQQQRNVESSAIAQRNNIRLAQLQLEISSATMFGPACDEFLEWLEDARAYNPGNEVAIMACAAAVRQNFEMGRWSSLRIFDTIHKYVKYLSDPSRVTIEKWRDEIRTVTLGESGSPATTTVNAATTTSSSRSQTSSPVVTPFNSIPIRHQQSESPVLAQSPQNRRLLPANAPMQPAHAQAQIPTSVGPVVPSMPLPQQYQKKQQQYMFQMAHQPTPQTPQVAPPTPPQQQQQQQQQQPHAPLGPPNFQVSWDQALWNHYSTVSPDSNHNAAAITAANLVNVNRAHMMAPPAATTTTASVAGAPAPKTNQLPFIRKIGYAVNPFRLKHNKTITRVPFFINPDGYTRMWKGSHPGPVDPNRLPISFVLTAWRDKTHENKCEWPDTIKLELNRTIPIITKRKKAHVPGRPNNVFSYQGKDKPLDAGGYLNQGNNELTIEQLDCACSYYFAIIMYVRESEEIITNWVQSRILDINNGRGIVNRLLGVAGSNNNGDDDLEICQTNVKIGLKCPISLQRIKVPTKGRDCNHADCFDLTSYLAVNHENASWKCPHCNEYTPPDKLNRDAFFEDLLKRAGKVAVEVEYTEDADHFRVIKSETPDPEDQPSADETGNVSATESAAVATTITTTTTTTVTAKVEPEVERNVISLLSDDEDEEEQEEAAHGGQNVNQAAGVNNNGEDNNTSRKRTANTEESVQTAQSESSVERSPATPGDIFGIKRPRHGEEAYQTQFAPMDTNELLNSFFALASQTGGGSNNSDNIHATTNTNNNNNDYSSSGL